MIRQLLPSPVSFLTVDLVYSSSVARAGKLQPVGQIWPSQIRPQAKNSFYISEQLDLKWLCKYQHSVFNFASWPGKPKLFPIWPFTRKVCCLLLYSIMILLLYNPRCPIVASHHAFAQAITAMPNCLSSTITG